MKLKITVIALTLSLSNAAYPLSINERNLVRTILSDGALNSRSRIEVGGANTITPITLERFNLNAGIGAEWSGLGSCNSFDWDFSLKQYFNAGRFKRAMTSQFNQLKGALNPGSLAGYLFSQANPDLAEEIKNGMATFQQDFNQAVMSCEQIQDRVLQVSGDNGQKALEQMAVSEKLTDTMSRVNSEDVDLLSFVQSDINGDDGVETPLGRRGGVGQGPVNITKDLTTVGYNALADRNLDATGSLSPATFPAAAVFPSPSDAADFTVEVVGDTEFMTCEGCESTKLIPGKGIKSVIQEDTSTYVVNLEALVAQNTSNITPDMLIDAAKNSGVAIDIAYIKALQNEPASMQSFFIRQLADEMAQNSAVKKLLTSRRILLAGRDTKEVSENEAVRVETDRKIAELTKELELLAEEKRFNSLINKDIAIELLDREAARAAQRVNFGSNKPQIDVLRQGAQ